MMPLWINQKNTGYTFSLRTEGPWLWSKKKTFPLAVEDVEKGTAVSSFKISRFIGINYSF